MSKYEKKGTITFSPTAITDKEEVHEFHKRTESSCECNPSSGFTLILVYAEDANTCGTVRSNVTYDDIVNMIEQRLPLVAFVHNHDNGWVFNAFKVVDMRDDQYPHIYFAITYSHELRYYADGRIIFDYVG